jgi:transmembrane sensor
VLNSDSVAQIRFDGGERRVILRRGEASFDVAHDGARPFLVTADDVTVRAVGTRFAVDMADDDVEVTVEEGVVAVTEPGSSAPPRLLRRNQQLVAAPTGVRRAALDEGEIGRRLAWRRRQLVFNGESLGRAAEQVNRYSDVRVTIDYPTLARAEFIGVFRMGDGRAFAHAAAQAFNGEVIARDDGLHLQRRPNSPSH